MARPPESEFVAIRVRDGEPVETGNWVYAWIDDTGRVVHVGSTGLDPQTRVWLHLHDPDPEIGRIAALFGRLAASELDVLAMSVPAEVPRGDVRDAVGARLADEGMLAADAITDHLQLVLDPDPEALDLADRYVTRLRAYLERQLANA